MHRKNILGLFLLLSSFSCAMAQRNVGTFSVTPKVGVCFSSLTGSPGIDLLSTVSHGVEDSYLTSNGSELKVMTDFTAGVEVSYQLTSILDVSLGASYSRMGCGISGLSESEWTIGGYSFTLDNAKYRMDYLNVPVMAGVYVWKGLAVRAGLQAGFCLNQSRDYEINTNAPSSSCSVTKNGYWYKERVFNDFNLSIPVGVSYEYKNVVAEVRHDFGLTNYITDEWNVSDKKKGRIHSTSVTIGYRFF